MLELSKRHLPNSNRRDGLHILPEWLLLECGRGDPDRVRVVFGG